MQARVTLRTITAKQLCDMLGNHPYAIEMAGKRLHMYRYLNPERLIQDIQDAQHDMVMTGLLGIGQQRSVKELLDESVDELDDHLRDMLVTMGGLFSTQASVNLLAKVADTDVRTVESTLGELERNGLLRLVMDDTAYYRLHDLTYSYAHALSMQTQNGNTVDGVHQFVQERVQDYDALEFDIMNILGAARAAYLDNDDGTLIAIMRLLVVDANYLTARGVSSAAMELLEAAILAAKRLNDDEAVHYLTGKLGNVYFQITSQFELAVEAYTESYDYAVKIGDLGRQAMLLSVVATSRFKAGMDEVEDYYELASKIAHQLGNVHVIANIINDRGFYEMEKDPPEYESATVYFNQAIQTGRQHVLPQIIITATMNKSKCEFQLGYLEQALESSQSAYQTALSYNNHFWIAYCEKNLAWCFQQVGKLKDAKTHYRNALNLAKKCRTKIFLKKFKSRWQNLDMTPANI